MRLLLHVLALAALLVQACAPVPPADEPRRPLAGDPGKDVIFVPSPPALVDKMLDMAGVAAGDFVIDLGSGDGRIVIAAAKRGARALGVEYNPDLVAWSVRDAAAQGVAGKAQFVLGDMYEADVSQASVLALFLTPGNLHRLMPKFRSLAPGSRIVNNGYRIAGWDEAQVGVAGDCGAWCTAYLYIVPADVAGTWRLPAGELTLRQEFETLSGTLSYNGGTLSSSGGVRPVEGRVRGDRIRFSAGLDEYIGRVQGGRMSGEARGAFGGYWSASRQK